MPTNANIAEPAKPRHWFQFRLRTLLIVVTAIPVLFLVCDRCGVRIADGWLDVEMRFQVVDAETGRAIPDATVELMGEAAPSTQAKITSLTTDGNGIASRLFHNCGCTWRTGMLGLSETFTAGPGADLVLHVCSADYEPTDWLTPTTRKFAWQSEYLGHRKARATIRIPMRRFAAAQSKAK